MRRISFFLLTTGLFWTGCIGGNSLGTSTTSQKNVDNMSRVSAGMTESQVLRIMRQPHSNKTIAIAEDRYEIWFYVTKPTAIDQSRMTHINLTPLTFKNGVLMGVGYEYYYQVLKRETNGGQIQQKKEPETQDTDLEKALQEANKPPSSPQAHPAQPQGKPAQPKPNSKPAQQQQPQGSGKPQQPPAEKKKQQNPKPVSMSKKPPAADAVPEAEPEAEKKPPLKEKDQQMIEDADEQNFDYW